MKILMLGWELPPHISGGLGIASQGIAEGLAKNGSEIDFFLPRKRKTHLSKSFKIIDASKMTPDLDLWRKKTSYIETLRETEMGMRLVPYLPPEIFEIAREKQVVVERLEDTAESELMEKVTLTGSYQDNLLNEISKYALLATQFVYKKKYDVIHAHDWVTFKAARMAAKESGLPLYTHCHSTEYDRNGFHAQPFVIEEERLGFEASKRIFCVSYKLKATIIDKYKISPARIKVIPNATDIISGKKSFKKTSKKKVLFIGRFTNQKSPGAFIDLARDLVNRGVDCEFSMLGSGYLEEDLKHKVEQMNLKKRFEFPGFLSREKVLERLDKADLLITPSSSEPFGLVVLEAIMKKVPVAVATGTGIADFIPSLPQADLWDKYNFVRLAERLLTEESFRNDCIKNCYKEASALSWENAGALILKHYQS